MPSEHDNRDLSTGEAVRHLGADIAALREDLSGLVAELDHRRHDLLDVRLQARRHAVGVGITAASLVGAAAGVVWLGMRRAQSRRGPLSRAARLREAVGRMVEQPERVAAEQTALGKVFTAAATAAVATAIKRSLDPALRAFVEQYRRERTAGPGARRLRPVRPEEAASPGA